MAQTHTARFEGAPAILDRGPDGFEMTLSEQGRKIVLVMSRDEVEQLREACSFALSFKSSGMPTNS